MNIKHNPYESVLFQIEAIRQRTPEILTQEYLVFIASLYGRKIESGDARIKDYADMTVFDVHDEIHLRTTLLHADNQRKLTEYKTKKRKEQDDAIKELLQLGT